MDKIIEALSKLLPQEQVSEVAEAIKAELEEAKKTMETEYSSKLEQAYAELSEELKTSEQTGYQGYEEAKAIISDLRNRLEMQQVEAKSAMDEGFEEAYQMLLAEKAKNENLEQELYEQFNGKLKEMRDYYVEKVHQFLEYKGQEMYEQVRREVMSDPRMVEHKIVLDGIVEKVANYLSEEDYNTACSSKLEETNKQLEDLKGQFRILEARSIRLNNENTKLNESVRQAKNLITESNKNEQKERTQKAEQVTGKGNAVTEEKIVAEYANKTPEKDAPVDTTLTENNGATIEDWNALAGTDKYKK